MILQVDMSVSTPPTVTTVIVTDYRDKGWALKLSHPKISSTDMPALFPDNGMLCIPLFSHGF